ncbi:MAG: hypothetical protein IJV31_04255 [Clostridia bacterium]|nr:hypothetical protein [Clostridia bacterium]
MNSKKMRMLMLLVAFIIGIGVFIVKVNNESLERAANSTKTQTSNNSNNIIEITDNYFIQQTNDIYFNLNDYIGKTIKMQGLVYSYDVGDEQRCYAVVRNTPGCCGNDGLAGVDIRYNGEYPEENTWVEVVGVVREDTVLGEVIPAIEVTSIEKKETGTTFVTN